ncbi:MAG: hypothetical protein BWY70_01565 [Bacteroidetes bacterium ADurb.Bin408]|nr:MAG: hypothetical protein BWY70_01565 [Bacteroidetes bacterium ADurb.Bin408]
MKKYFFTIFLTSSILLLFNACQKEKNPQPTPTPTPTVNPYLAGLGDHIGYPAGTPYTLPPVIHLVSDIRGGYYSKSSVIKKNKSYKGPFPINLIPKNWVYYGTGTYVELYFKLYNTLTTDTLVIIPGGLIFCDSLDNDTSNGIYQRGFILQNDTIYIHAHDTAYVVLEAYCLNANLSASDYGAVYYIGPVTSNPNLNQIVTIMSAKQYPFGHESEIQDIIWNVTDYGQNITQQEIQFLNNLP